MDHVRFREYHDALFVNQGRLGAELCSEIGTRLEVDLHACHVCLENDDDMILDETGLDFAITTRPPDSNASYEEAGACRRSTYRSIY